MSYKTPLDGSFLLFAYVFRTHYSKDVGTVLVGLDRAFNYYKLQYAQLCLNFNKGSLLLATNRDGVGNFTPSQVNEGSASVSSFQDGQVMLALPLSLHFFSRSIIA